MSKTSFSRAGGHVALIGSLFPVAPVVQLSPTCDAVIRAPADRTTWTGSGVATQWPATVVAKMG